MKSERDIEFFIPQRAPFVFVSRVEDVSLEQARTLFTVEPDCPLVTDGCLTLAGVMENAAQTCAARAGWVQRTQELQVKIGYIGAIKQLQTTRLPKVGETLTTEAHVIQEVLNISLIECTTRIGDELIATTTLKLATID